MQMPSGIHALSRLGLGHLPLELAVALGLTQHRILIFL